LNASDAAVTTSVIAASCDFLWCHKVTSRHFSGVLRLAVSAQLAGHIDHGPECDFARRCCTERLAAPLSSGGGKVPPGSLVHLGQLLVDAHRMSFAQDDGPRLGWTGFDSCTCRAAYFLVWHFAAPVDRVRRYADPTELLLRRLNQQVSARWPGALPHRWTGATARHRAVGHA
jgi:hypothetical protein